MTTHNQQPDGLQRGAPNSHAQTDALGFWLASGIHRFAIDPRRRLGGQGRARRLLTEERRDPPASSEAWQSLASTLDRHTLLGGMTELSPEERRVLTLAYLEGRSNREIAAMQGVSVSTVGRYLHEALKLIDAYLARAGSWLSAMLLLGAGCLVAAATRLGRSPGAVRSAGWGERLASTAAVGAVAAAAIGVTAVRPDSTSHHRSATQATVQAAAAPAGAGSAAPRGQSGVPTTPRTVVVAADRSGGAGPRVTANGQKTGGHACNGKAKGPPTAPPGLQKHHPHGPPKSHPAARGCRA